MQKLLSKIDDFIDNRTMYQIVLDGLFFLVFISVILSITKKLSYSIFALIISLFTLLLTSIISNHLLAKVLKRPLNIESALITALILFLTLYPANNLKMILWLILASFLAIASKYILSFRQKHIFNPAAFGLFAISFFGAPIAIWWVGSSMFLPFSILVAILIIKKIRHFKLFFVYIITSVFVVSLYGLLKESNILNMIIQHFTSWPTIFFASIMLTEPSTMPQTKKFNIIMER